MGKTPLVCPTIPTRDRRSVGGTPNSNSELAWTHSIFAARTVGTLIQTNHADPSQGSNCFFEGEPQYKNTGGLEIREIVIYFSIITFIRSQLRVNSLI